jgi:AhpD family alkylhydroperoxidase
MLPQPVENYPLFVRLLFWFQKRKYGEVLNSSLIWAKSPRIFLALSWLYGSLDRKNFPLSPVIRTLIIVRVSQLNGCSFCVDLNTSVLLERGCDLEKVQALHKWKDSPLFREEEKLLLEYVDAVTDSKGAIDLDMRDRMARHFSQQDLVEITALIAFQNMSTKFNNAFGLEPQGFCLARSSNIVV